MNLELIDQAIAKLDEAEHDFERRWNEAVEQFGERMAQAREDLDHPGQDRDSLSSAERDDLRAQIDEAERSFHASMAKQGREFRADVARTREELTAVRRAAASG